MITDLNIGDTERITNDVDSYADSWQMSLRPTRLDEYIGQFKAKTNLSKFIKAAISRKESLDHVLLYGPPGLGKTTLAGIIASEMGVSFRQTSAPALGHKGDLAAILTTLQPGDILFIDEIHRLTHQIEESIYSAMEDFAIDIVYGKGAGAQSIRLDLSPFTLIGATTKTGMLSSPLRDRFGIKLHLDYYDIDSLVAIISRTASLLAIRIEKHAANEIAKRSRGTPRIANRLLKRVRDIAQIDGDGNISLHLANKALDMLEIDKVGLDYIDLNLLETMINKFDGGPVGLTTLSAALGDSKDTIEEVYEPFLIQLGFLQRTPRGRIVTRLGYEHFGLIYPDKQS